MGNKQRMLRIATIALGHIAFGSGGYTLAVLHLASVIEDRETAFDLASGVAFVLFSVSSICLAAMSICLAATSMATAIRE